MMANELANALFEALTQEHRLPAGEAAKFVEQFFETIKEGLAAEKQVRVRGLGTFKLQTVRSRDSITFSPEPSMKELVNKPFSHFESVALKDGVEFEDPKEEPREEPEKETQPEKEPKPSAETQPDSEPSAEESDIYEYDDEPSPLRRRLIMAAVMCAIFVAGYFVGRYMCGETHTEPATKKTTAAPAEDKSGADSTQSDTARRSAPPAAPKTEDSYAAMNSDPRIKYGAYNIIGVERVVVLKQGETLESLSKQTLGADMIGYFQVLNNATSLSAGDSVKIPKVELRPEYRNRK